HAEFMGAFGEKGKESGARRHRIGRDVVASAGERPEADGRDAVEDDLVLDLGVARQMDFQTLVVGQVLAEVVSLAGRFPVLGNHLFPLAGEVLGQIVFEFLYVGTEYAEGYSDRHRACEYGVAELVRKSGERYVDQVLAFRYGDLPLFAEDDGIGR